MSSLKLSDLPKGTEIYYTGDMANSEGFGEVSRNFVDKFGQWVDVTFDDGRTMLLSISNFSDRYSGTGLTRFVTKKAYSEYSEIQKRKLDEFIAASKGHKKADPVYFTIIADLITGVGSEFNVLDGQKFELPIRTGELVKRHFKLYDDDGELYFIGEYFDDPHADNQEFILDWAMNNFGCTEIHVRDAAANTLYKVEIS